MRLPRHLLACLALVLFATASTCAAERSEFTLANGLRVRLVPGRADKKVVVLLGVRAGFFDEPPGVPHLAHVTEHLAVFDLKPGSDETKAVGKWYAAGQANAETLADFMYFDLLITPEELPRALSVQAARLAGAQFADATLKREIPRTLQEVEALERSPTGGTGKFAWCPFVQAALHAQTNVPLKAKTRTITVDKVRAFHGRTFRPDRAILYVIGEFEPAAARKVIEAAFTPIVTPAQPPSPRPLPKAGTQTVTWDVTTTHLLLAWTVPPASHADHAALTLASFTLMNCLFRDREIAALAQVPLVDNDVEGLFLVNLQAKPGADLNTLQAKIEDRVARLSKADGFGDAELHLARAEFVRAMKPMNLDGVSLPARVPKAVAMANLEIRKMGWELVWGDLTAYVKRVEALDAGAVRAAVARHLGPKNAVVVRLMPAK
jgi:zinc protease